MIVGRERHWIKVKRPSSSSSFISSRARKAKGVLDKKNDTKIQPLRVTHLYEEERREEVMIS